MDPSKNAPETNGAPDDLTGPKEERITMLCGNLSQPGPFSDYQDYHDNGKIFRKVDLLVWKLAAHPPTEIAIPAKAADYSRIAAPDAVSLLKMLPDLRLISRLTISDSPNEDEGWFRQVSKLTLPKEQLAIQAKAEATGALTLFRPDNVENVYESAAREWMYLLFKSSSNAASVFADVGDLEELQIDSKKDMKEPSAVWCRFGLAILALDPAVPVVVAELNPIRCAVVAGAIVQRMQTLPDELKTDRHQPIISICNHIMRRVAANAVIDLNRKLENPSVEQVSRIANILAFLQSAD